MASNAIRANSGFLCRYPLLAVVVSALLAHVVRALHCLAARTRLDGHGLRLLVRVARALLPLGGASFRDGHFLCSVLVGSPWLRTWYVGQLSPGAAVRPAGFLNASQRESRAGSQPH